MAITPLAVTLSQEESAVIALLRSSEIDGKGCNEVFHALDALRVWKDWFEDKYGQLTRIDQRSNPDDPPDMDLVLEKTIVPLEHTELKPHPFGMVDDIHHKEYPDQCITLPALSKNPKTRPEITNAMFSYDAPWASSHEEDQAWLSALKVLIARKLRKQGAGILLVQDTALRMSEDVRNLALGLQAEMGRTDAPFLGDCTVLLHSRLNSVQFMSFLFQRGQDLQQRSKL